jgi:transposase
VDPEERRAKAAEWSKRGMTNGAIAARLGVATATIRRYLNPEYAASCKRAAAAYRKEHPEKTRVWDTRPCPSCKKTRVYGKTRQCRACEREERGMRWSEIQALWEGENLTSRQIAARTGRTVTAVQVDIARMRKAGWTLTVRSRRETDALNRSHDEALSPVRRKRSDSRG